MGINLLLTPVFTPPLDTAVGGERPTVQLVDVTVRGREVRSALTSWIATWKWRKPPASQYFEISHLFTQWGATAAPKFWPTWTARSNRYLGGTPTRRRQSTRAS